MPSNCPLAPSAPDDSLVLQMLVVKAGKRLARFHGPIYPGDSFNPNAAKQIDVVDDGARFNPFPGHPSTNIPTIYAADSMAAAALESVFHNVEHVSSPTFPRMQLEDWRYSQLGALRDLTVFRLTNPHLRQLTVPGRVSSLEEGELIHSPISEYPNTRTWARFLHDSVTELDGLAWRPRLGGEGWSYVFFGDRCGTGALKAVSGPERVDSGRRYNEVDQIAKAASIRIIDSKTRA